MEMMVFPELDSILSKFNIIKYDFGLPNIVLGSYNCEFNTNNIFSLLFDNQYEYDTVNYLFENRNEVKYEVSLEFRNRFSVNPKFQIYLASSSSSASNIFNFNNEDINLINQFLLYRKQDPTFDFSSIDYNQLSDTGINIYLLLDLLVNNNYFNSTIIKFNNLLSRILFFHLTQLKIDYLSNNNKTFLINDEY